MKKLLFIIMVLGICSHIKADLFGDRAAFPTYTRVLKNPMPRVVVVQPTPRPPILAQEQRSQEDLAQRQILEKNIRDVGHPQEVLATHGQVQGQPLARQPLSNLTDEQLHALYKNALQRQREAEITGYTHMYGASEYGYSDQYPR